MPVANDLSAGPSGEKTPTDETVELYNCRDCGSVFESDGTQEICPTCAYEEHAGHIAEDTMKFKVAVVRTERRTHTFEVDAKDRDAAEEAALEACGDYDFHDSPIDCVNEEVVGVEEA